MELPAGLGQSFGYSAAELGFCAASWLFLRAVAEQGGDAAVETLRDQLGRTYPVLDAVASAWLEGMRAPQVDVAPLLAACAGARRALLVGIEADHLDALVPRLLGEGIDVALLQYSLHAVNWGRVLDNFGDRVTATDLTSFQGLAGSRSVIITMVYGAQGHNVHVLPAWLRVHGADVRAQFRSLIGWDVLRRPMFVYPRWLVEVPASDFTHLL